MENEILKKGGVTINIEKDGSFSVNGLKGNKIWFELKEQGLINYLYLDKGRIEFKALVDLKVEEKNDHLYFTIVK